MIPGLSPDVIASEAGVVLARRIGLRLDPALRSRLSRCVTEEASAHDLGEAAYVSMLDADPTLLQGLIDRVTVQETSFFRHLSQFEAFGEFLTSSRRQGVRVWSAGCANGQEPYSLAMILHELGVRDWQVTASDISAAALDRTRRARYSEKELEGLSAERRQRHFNQVAPDEWELAEPVRARVRVIRNNLAADPPPLEPDGYDAVFCRNVLIYLRPADVAACLQRVARVLRSEGRLFLGYSETIWQVTDKFELVRLAHGFAYCPRSTRVGARVASPSPARPMPVEAHPITRGFGAAESGAAGIPTVALMAEGEAAMNAGDFATAVTIYRRCIYLDPDQPVCHLYLGFAHEAAGDAVAARRAYRAARTALDRSGTAIVEATLEGYQVGELVRLLDAKVAVPGSGE